MIKSYECILIILCLSAIQVESQIPTSVHLDTIREKGQFTIYQTIDYDHHTNSVDTFDFYYIGTVSRYYNNGILKERKFSFGDHVYGNHESYYPSGKLNDIYVYAYDKGYNLYMKFFENGLVNYYGKYVKAKELYYNADTSFLGDTIGGSFHYLITCTENPEFVKDGNWFYWDSTGKLLKTVLWKEDRVIKEY